MNQEQTRIKNKQGHALQIAVVTKSPADEREFFTAYPLQPFKIAERFDAARLCHAVDFVTLCGEDAAAVSWLFPAGAAKSRDCWRVCSECLPPLSKLVPCPLEEVDFSSPAVADSWQGSCAAKLRLASHRVPNDPQFGTSQKSSSSTASSLPRLRVSKEVATFQSAVQSFGLVGAW
ncbi:MAG: hypothetical protein R3C59_04845 [Planctomycetaceae bacterium]